MYNVYICIYLVTSPYISVEVNFQWDDEDIHFVLDQHIKLDFYCASSLNQQVRYSPFNTHGTLERKFFVLMNNSPWIWLAPILFHHGNYLHLHVHCIYKVTICWTKKLFYPSDYTYNKVWSTTDNVFLPEKSSHKNIFYSKIIFSKAIFLDFTFNVHVLL